MENNTDIGLNQCVEEKRSESCNILSLSTMNTKIQLTHESPVDQRADLCSRNSLTTLSTQVVQTSENIVEQSSQQWTSSEDVESNSKMKIFTSVMLHAWRQRRADVRRLQQIVDNLQRHSIHSKNELRVSNTLMHVEKKRCKELQVQLRDSTICVNKVRSSCDELNTSLDNLRIEKTQLEQTLNFWKHEYKEMERKANDSKQDLLQMLLKEHGLQQQLSKEQNFVEQLMREKEQLLDEASQMRNLVENIRKENNSNILDLNQKNEEIIYLRSIIDSLDQRRTDLHIKGTTLLHNIDERKRTVGAARAIEKEFAQMRYNKGKLQDQAKTLKWNLVQLAEEYGIFQILTKVQYYTARSAFILWLLMLPQNSLRYGCMPYKQKNRGRIQSAENLV